MMRACVVALALGGCVPIPSTGSVELPVTAAKFADFDAHLNAARSAPIAHSAQLSQIAAAHSADMQARGYFSHVLPEGRKLGDRFHAGGLKYCKIAENIAQGQAGEAQVFVGWMNSPAHSKNMLDTSFNSYGIGRVADIWTMVFYKTC